MSKAPDVGRVFFHEHKKPAVCFVVGEEICAGQITDLSDDGLTILCDRPIEVEAGTFMRSLYVGRIEENNKFEHLYVGRVKRSEVSGNQLLKVVIGDAEQVRKFRALLADPKRPAPRAGVDFTALPRVDKARHYTSEGVGMRLEWLRALSGSPLENLEKHAFRVESLAGNIENFIGAVQVPVGVAGPLHIKGLYAVGHFPIPIATTEGALVASLNRGAVALNRSGGVTVHVRRQLMMRAPVFFCRDLHGALNLERWIHEHEETIKEKCATVSSVARLQEVKTFVFGRCCHVQFIFLTGDAAGQNMTTSCTFFACEWIVDKIRKEDFIGFDWFMIDGNMSGDKKVSYQNFILGRGVAVTAQAFIPDEVIRTVLRTDAARMVEGMQMSEVGAAQIGMIGHNINCANVIAGMFTATGQDIASVHESSLAMLKISPADGGIQLSLSLPSLVIGTVGGGTGLPTQRECLEILGCAGQGQLYKFAEIIASACLALDLSTASAITTNEFVSAHDRLGRNRPSAGLSRSDLNLGFFQALVGTELRLQGVEQISLRSNSGIINEIVSAKAPGVSGLFRYAFAAEGGQTGAFVLKLKSHHEELSRLGVGIARLSGDDALPGLFEQNLNVFSFSDSDHREIELYQTLDPRVLAYLPRIFGTRLEPAREIFAVLMEDLSEALHLDTVMTPELWQAPHLTAALDGLAAIHACYLDRTESLPATVTRKGVAEHERASFLFSQLLDFNTRRAPHMFAGDWLARQKAFIARVGEHVAIMNAGPVTLVHHDFNTRNICLRPGRDGHKLVVYDWELACIAPPQRDLVELLVYALPPQSDATAMREWCERYRVLLEQKSGTARPREAFEHMLAVCALELAVSRLGLYWLVHNVKRFPFLERVTGNLRVLIEGLAHV